MSSSEGIENGSPDRTSPQTTKSENHDQHAAGGDPQGKEDEDGASNHKQVPISQSSQDQAPFKVTTYAHSSLDHSNGALKFQDGIPENSVSVPIPEEADTQVPHDRGDLGKAIISGIQAAIEPTENKPSQIPSEVDWPTAKTTASMPPDQEDGNAVPINVGKGEISYKKADTTNDHMHVTLSFLLPWPFNPFHMALRLVERF